ncbi:hypothetical protein [Photobacterium ganghwense]|uniref:hypothetical protein n=1 Tax=Photobacterium ganghwense TaxID=320778 RepID=UPI001A8E5DE0|nr:hypothetical protein [Photobacterium ganghwense]QSV17531.1 hypothetical protein FH974_25840 [Photobacterium ganghwense]
MHILHEVQATSIGMLVNDVKGQVDNTLVYQLLSIRAHSLLNRLGDDKAMLCQSNETLSWVNAALDQRDECLLGTLNALAWLCRFLCTRQVREPSISPYVGSLELYDLLDQLRTEYGNLIFAVEDAGYRVEHNQAFGNVWGVTS